MDSPTPRPSRFRKALRTLWLIPLAGFGFLLAAAPHAASAAADGLLPTITIPSLPITVTLPVTLPTLPLPTTTAGTAPTTTTSPSTTTGASSTPGAPPSAPTPTPPESEAGAGGATGIDGARQLANGAVSIPVTSVTAPARLLIVVSVQPRTILRAAQPIKTSVEVRDTRGYVVRGAAVSIRSVPTGKLVKVRSKRSGENGRASFVVRLRSGRLRTGTFLLHVRAGSPVASTTMAVTRRVRLVVKARH